jgi:hypothetical protein
MREIQGASQDGYSAAVAPQAVEVGEDSLTFPGGVLLPLTLRGGASAPGMPERPWGKLPAGVFQEIDAPTIYSLALRRQLPDVLRGSLRARRTLFEGLLLALAEKTGRRPSMAEQAMDQAMDAAESAVALGRPAFQAMFLLGLCAARGRESEAEAARRQLETLLRARGFMPQRLVYIAERALLHFQPGGELFPGLEAPTLLLEEIVPLLPTPERTLQPAPDALWLGVHARDGRDVFFSFSRGLDPTTPSPPHALSLILGEMGAGKTSLLRLILLQRLLQGRAVVSLDPEGENNRLCQALGGRVIPAGPPDDPETCLLQPLAGEDPAEMLLSVRFLLSALSGEAALSPGAQAALHEAVRRRWERRPGNMALIDLLEALAALGMAEAAGPLALLRPYAQGGLLSGFFDRPKALLSPHLPPGAWWNFDLSGLRQESRDLVHAALSWFFYHAVTVGKQPVDVFIDEGWRLLRGGPFADLLDELGRRARKRGVGVMLSTHLPGDLARQASPERSRGAASLGLAATAFVGRLPPEEAFAFFRSLGVPEGESGRRAEQAGRLPPHTFLAAPAGGRGALFPLQVVLPSAWLEFWKALGSAR